MIYVLLEHQMNHIFNGENIFIRTQIFFRIDAVFEADNEIDNSSIGSKTTNIYMSKVRYWMVII